MSSYKPAPSTEEVASRTFQFGKATLVRDDCLSWFERQPANSLHGVVADPPYGLIEYSDLEQEKLRSGRGGVWRILYKLPALTRKAPPALADGLTFS